MKTPKSILALTALVSTTGVGLIVPTATAQEVEEVRENINESETSDAKEEKTDQTDNITFDNSGGTNTVDVSTAVKTSDVDSIVEKEKLPKVEKGKDKSDSFLAHVYVYTSTGVKTVVVKEKDSNLETELEKLNVNPAHLKLATGEKVDTSDSLKDGDALVLFSNESESTIEEVTMDAPVQIIEDENMFEGEEEVIEEGKSGLAIQTTVTKKNLSVDHDKNAKADIAKERQNLSIAEKTLTILESPEVKIIKKGIKKLPELQNLARTSINNANTALNTLSSSSIGSSSIGNAGEGTFGVDYSSKVAHYKEQTSNAAVKLALDQVGKAYVWGAVGPTSFDCSGLIYWVYKTQLGMDIPRVADAQGQHGTPIAWSDIKPGDVIWNSGHIGMYIGDGQMVHASNPTRGVVIDGISWAQNSGFQVARF